MEKMITDDVIKNGGNSNIPGEATDPQGSCCLGDISQVIKKTLRSK